MLVCVAWACSAASSPIASGEDQLGINGASVEKQGAKDFEDVMLASSREGKLLGPIENCVLAP